MKKVKPYLPFEIDFINSDLHSDLIERYGAHGLGIYFMVLMELRGHEGYRCSLSSIKAAARRCLADPEILESVLCDFGLFEFQEYGNRVLISSVYIDRVMQPFDEKTRDFSSTASENTVTVERPVYGMSTVTHREIINIIKTIIKTKTTTTTTNTRAATTAKVVAAVAVANSANDVVVVGDSMPKAGCAMLRKYTSARTPTAISVAYGDESAILQSGQSCRKYLEKTLPTDGGWRQCPVSRGKAPPHLHADAAGGAHGATRVGEKGKCYLHFTQMLPSFHSNETFIWLECYLHLAQMKPASGRE